MLGGPFCGVGVLLKKVPGSHGMRVAFWSHPISSYSTDLASVAHTMIADLGMAAVLLRLLLRKDSIPQTSNSWSGSEKPIGWEAKPCGSKEKPRKGLEEDYDLWKRTMVSTIIFIYRTGGRSLGREIVFTIITEPWL